MADFHIDTLGFYARCRSPRVSLHRRSETNSDKVEWYSESLRHALNSVGNEGTGCSPHLPLFFDLWIFNRDGNSVGFGVSDLYVRSKGNGRCAEGAGNGEFGRGGCEGDGGRVFDGVSTYVGDMLVKGGRGAEGAGE